MFQTRRGFFGVLGAAAAGTALPVPGLEALADAPVTFEDYDQWSESLRTGIPVASWLPSLSYTRHEDGHVVNVTAFEAEAYAAAHGRRLPTEDELLAMPVSQVPEIWEWSSTEHAAAGRRVLRVGSWNHYRHLRVPTYRNLFVGFRVVRES